MITMQRNTTYYSCPICSEQYDKKETRDTKKVVETACRHFFHIKCIENWNNHLGKNHRSLSCGYCAQIYLERRQPDFSVFHDIKTFNSALEYLENLYSYDSVALNAFTQVSNLYEEIFGIHQEVYLSMTELDLTKQETMSFLNDFIEQLKDLVINNEEIKPELKGDVMRTIGAIISKSGVLRTLKGESMRWTGIPFDMLPEKIRKEGVPVSIGEIKVRVSADYLRRSVLAFLVDDIASAIYEIPRNIFKSVSNITSCALRYFGSTP